ncbi:restriction endonuclease subunit S [Burkholderia ubonensis]|uniref:hypothetical protein n=1 Tax=Burkholderia ubonensis TaxID=101571 RepID=UPI002AB08D5A|nr:hypothetical protein [Burkholderia ubonensis]
MSMLPPGWIETLLGTVIDYGTTVKVEPENIADDAWILELEDIEKDTSKIVGRFSFGERRSKSAKNHFIKGDVLYGKLRPYLNKVVVADSDGLCTTEIIPIKSAGATDNRYVFYWLKSPRFLSYTTEASHGLNMPRLGTEAGRKAPFVLAPLSEQKRIAKKLDDVLARVDAARVRLDRVPMLLKRFRQTVLEAATSGKLTEGWRGAEEPQWRRICFNDACEEITVGHVGKMAEAYRESGIPFLRSLNVRPFKYDSNDLRYISSEFHKTILKSRLRSGDVVVVRSGSPGQCCVIPEELNEANCSDLVIIRPGEQLLPRYACIVINSEASQAHVRSKQVGVAQQHFNVGSMKLTPLFLPPVEEQQEIVRRVESLFAVADKVQAQYECARERLEQITPAILAKAFRGGLVPQDPNDESAQELLERVKTQASTAPSVRKKPRTLTN